ncbi:amylosucrase [Kineococcus xinjiangensis]|uniref:Amylosucrase n=1 Tax=Kineococcus xinjiangensis TaxID=512762 RepID=A0A2S6IKG8_9ACTN|nr:alpha-amylase family protein [Kineococcus xinjiangensis]PPK94675.1 amylosucrase [Kineococcus xinjiangensis]
MQAAHAVREAADLLATATADRRELFELRVQRWWPDLHAGLSAVYPPVEAEALERRLARAAAACVRDRDPDLARLDAVRTLRPDWFQEPGLIGYAAYTERFAGDLQAVRGRIPYLQELGVGYLHLMPLLQPREGDNDGGYAVADYRRVRADLGTVEDLRELARELRSVGISLVLDLVLNHVAREHEWARAARAGDSHHRGYFHVFGDREVPDAFERTLPEVFPDFAPGNFTYDDELGGWVWTTFNSWQWDVDWANPHVFSEYADIVLFLAGLGVEVLRLDAIAFLWKRMGTSCQNEPEVHALTRALRALVRIACPATVFKAEAIVAPADLVHYLGTGPHHGKVSDLAYHNSLMVQVWSMLAAGDVTLAAHALRQLPPVPASTAWITYARCHDDIGWAIDDADAAAVGLSGAGHRSFLSDHYSGLFPGSGARGLVFQHNPATGDRRISGTAAALSGLEAAVEDGDAAAVSEALARHLLAHAVVMGWGGIPVVWSGDELGLGNDPDWAAEEGHGGDNRWAHRPRLPEEALEQRHCPGSVPARVFGGVRRIGSVRAGLPHLHASVPAEVLDVTDPGVLPVLRRHPLGPFLALYNVTGGWRSFPRTRLEALGLGGADDVLRLPEAGRHGAGPHYGDDGNMWLPPYAAVWLVQPGQEPSADAR